MKRKKNMLEGLVKHPFFDKERLRTEVERFGLSEHSANAYLKDSSIIRLKRDFYIHKKRFNEDKSDLSYTFYIANNLRPPSYVSLESAMQFYGLMTETVSSTITSVTSKVTRSYNTKMGKFTYRSIREALFDYFEIYTKGNYKFLIATNFKSIFDYLYYFTNMFRNKIDNNIFDALRIDVQELSARDRKRFNKLIKDHTNSVVRI
ncbi:hypothetical protein KKA47_02950 [bacterium]|nr:hypothetical protein [bacterium]